MLNVQFSGVSLNALAVVSDDGRHLQRTLSFADGQQKVLGCIIGRDGEHFTLTTDGSSSERIEITQGECEVSFMDGDTPIYYREGQSFVVAQSTTLRVISDTILQYVRHFEG